MGDRQLRCERFNCKACYCITIALGTPVLGVYLFWRGVFWVLLASCGGSVHIDR